jgi:hypothetical protein
MCRAGSSCLQRSLGLKAQGTLKQKLKYSFGNSMFVGQIPGEACVTFRTSVCGQTILARALGFIGLTTYTGTPQPHAQTCPLTSSCQLVADENATHHALRLFLVLPHLPTHLAGLSNKLPSR